MQTRRGLIAGGAALAAAWPASGAEPASDIRPEQDFDELWRTLDERYCFFAEKATDWNLVRETYRPLAAAARSDAAYLEVLRLTLNELYDAHTRLAEPPAASPRFPPFDLWAEPHPDGARVAMVQPRSGAAEAGIAPGDLILAVDRIPVVELAAKRQPRCLVRADPEADLYAVQSAVAGLRGQDRKLTVRSGRGQAREVIVTRPRAEPEAGVTHRRLDRGFGYIRIPSFAEAAAVEQFDAALAAMRDARGLVLDVRSNGGGDTAVARPIMGRFITEPKVYATMRRRFGEGLTDPWREWVEPRGPFTWTRPVVVLVDRWSASMAEGFPMGMREVAGARIVGTPMMGLGAAVYQIRLDRTGVQAQYSAEPVYSARGEPRWKLQPDRLVTPTTLSRDEIREAGVRELGRRRQAVPHRDARPTRGP